MFGLPVISQKLSGAWYNPHSHSPEFICADTEAEEPAPIPPVSRLHSCNISNISEKTSKCFHKHKYLSFNDPLFIISGNIFSFSGSLREFVGKLMEGIHQNLSSIKRKSCIIGRFAPFYSVCRLTAAGT